MQLQGLVFDFDGTIIDSESTFLQSWVEEYEVYGAPWDPTAWLAAVGSYVPDWDAYAQLGELVGKQYDRAESEQRRRARELALVGATEPLPGIVQHLQAAKAAGVRIGLASSSPVEWVMEHLRRLQLDEYFATLVCRADVTAKKPDPEPYRLVCERLDVEPAATVAVEDSRNGAIAATAAGLFCVAVANPITRLQDLGPADLQVESLAQLSFDELAALPFG